jgi:nucleoside-diphosphate-sugar epimerase
VHGVEYALVDLLDRDRTLSALKEASPDHVVHLAARTDLDGLTEGDYADNTIGVENLLAAIRAVPGIHRAICTSSQLVCRIGYRPAHEEDYAPTTAYGRSKVRTEQIWRAADGGGTVWCLVRPTTIWGPGMSAHYLRFFRMIRDGRYFHVGGGPTYKSYGYVGNTVQQYLRLLDAPREKVQRRMFFLADYQPFALEDWTNAFQLAMGAPRIRTVPRGLAGAAAKIGDLINLAGFQEFPFNSFRLNNVLTVHQVDLTATREVCGAPPFTMAEGIEETVAWLRKMWQENEGAVVALHGGRTR